MKRLSVLSAAPVAPPLLTISPPSRFCDPTVFTPHVLRQTLCQFLFRGYSQAHIQQHHLSFHGWIQ